MQGKTYNLRTVLNYEQTIPKSYYGQEIKSSNQYEDEYFSDDEDQYDTEQSKQKMANTSTTSLKGKV